jgi:hypothetical protein
VFNPQITLYLQRIVFVVVAGVLPGICARSSADNHYFAAGVVSWHLRDGSFDFGNSRIEKVELKTLRTQGFVAGKNFALPLQLRLGLPLRLEYGKATADTVMLRLEGETTPQPLSLNSVFFQVGCEPILQLPYQFSPRGRGCLGIGGGIHYASMSEEEITMDGTRRNVTGDPYLEKGSRATFSVTAGHGFEMAVNPALSLSLAYNFRYWIPVKRKVYRDLFPIAGVPYSERFFTHSISAGLLFARERDH